MKTVFIITITLMIFVLGMIVGGLANAKDLGEGYGIEMEYVNVLQQLEETVWNEDNAEYVRLVNRLSGLGMTIAMYNCGEFTHPIKVEICHKNTFANIMSEHNLYHLKN